MSLRIDGAPAKLAITKVSFNDSTPTQMVPSRAGRALLYFFPSNQVYLGTDNTVTQNTGALSGSLTWPIATAAGLWGIAQSGQTVTAVVVETYDEEA